MLASRAIRHPGAWPRSFILAVCGVLMLAGCRSREKPPPQPLTPPQASVVTRHFSGTTLSGPLAQAATLQTGSVARVDVRVVATAPPAIDGLAPIGPLARLILRDGQGDVVAPYGQLGHATLYRLLEPDAELTPMLGDTAAWAEIGSAAGVVGGGTTFAVDIANPDRADRVSVQVFRSGDEPRYELAVQRESGAGTTSANARPVRETIVVARDLSAGGATAERVLLLLPMAFGDSPASRLAIDLAVNFAPDDIDDLVEAARRDLSESAARAAEQLKITAPKDPGLAAARDALLSAGEDARRPLTYLAQLTDARITEAVALVADDALVTIITRTVREQLPDVKADDAASVGWLLERATIQAVASMKDSENAHATLTPVLGVLQGIAGQAGVQLDVLQSIASQSAGTADLTNRLIAEHLIFLEDSSPAVRVRSYDWLKARDKAPPDYDPLARPRDRRAALEKFREQQTNATTQPR